MVQLRSRLLPPGAADSSLCKMTYCSEKMSSNKPWSRWLQFLRGPAWLVQKHAPTHGRDALLEDVMKLMESRHSQRILVVMDGELIGVIGRADLLRALSQEGKTIPSAAPPGSDLTAQVLGLLRRQDWHVRDHVTIAVANHIVYLEVSSRTGVNATRVGSPTPHVTRAKEGPNQYDCFDPGLGLTYG